ncbi:hypothetical protein BS78_10G181100 [Paspalum vaginatum]|nr:hypothetical protein BS78_10G181100 [Paspalum vaginatum]
MPASHGDVVFRPLFRACVYSFTDQRRQTDGPRVAGDHSTQRSSVCAPAGTQKTHAPPPSSRLAVGGNVHRSVPAVLAAAVAHPRRQLVDRSPLPRWPCTLPNPPACRPIPYEP